jgi:hypothetical protein
MGALLPWVMWQESEADHLPPSGAEVAHIHVFMVCNGTTVPVFLMFLGRKSLIIFTTSTRLLPFRIYEISSN